MAKTATPTSIFTDAFIAGVKQSQELVYTGLTTCMDLAGKPFTVPDIDTLPFSELVPSAKDVVTSSFGFAEELLAVQKDFATKVLDTLIPKATTAKAA